MHWEVPFTLGFILIFSLVTVLPSAEGQYYSIDDYAEQDYYNTSTKVIANATSTEVIIHATSMKSLFMQHQLKSLLMQHQ